MRRIARHALDGETLAALDNKQADATRKYSEGTLQVAKDWENARKTIPLRTVLATLKAMMGAHERCMYCLDSHGTDIEHFWPKAPYPQRMFQWPNLLLCCAECGRFKGDQFPLDDGAPLLIDPTAENPWDHLDFDPTTGNIVARFEIDHADWSSKGQATVDLLQLDRREALAAGYRRTFLRLSALVERYLVSMPADGEYLPAQLMAHDDHGLIWWCFRGAGRNQSPFVELRKQQPTVWRACLAVLDAVND
jgi:uncharacterized protein (TIGR02646 family)